MEHPAFMPAGVHTRWASFENPAAAPGAAARSNFGAKGSPNGHLFAGQTVTLMEHTGAGEVRRIWMTVQDRSPAALRSIILRCYWDGCDKPAAEVPLGDFMLSDGGMRPFSCAYFSDPEGRSFNCYIPMPFRTGARITLTNESDRDIPRLFYDVDFLSYDAPREDLLYFHAWFHRSLPVEPERDHVILDTVRGCGRFLGASFSVHADPVYGDSWWGEGEVKVYMDGDSDFPTLAGTGTEDYIGTAWGQGTYCTPFQGCLLADPGARHWTFFRFHGPDPVYFHSDIRVTIQDIGGDSHEKVRALVDSGAPLIPVTCDIGPEAGFLHLYRRPMESWPEEGWINFYRQDDFATVAYFYLDRPVSDLPPLQDVAVRTAGLRSTDAPKDRDAHILLET